MSDYDVINDSLDDEVRYCKKGGCELMSTNEGTLCENCKRGRAGFFKKALSVIGAIAAVAVVVKTKGDDEI